MSLDFIDAKLVFLLVLSKEKAKLQSIFTKINAKNNKLIFP